MVNNYTFINNLASIFANEVGGIIWIDFLHLFKNP